MKELIEKLHMHGMSLLIVTKPEFYDNFVIQIWRRDNMKDILQTCIRWDHLTDEYIKNNVEFLIEQFHKKFPENGQD